MRTITIKIPSLKEAKTAGQEALKALRATKPKDVKNRVASTLHNLASKLEKHND